MNSTNPQAITSNWQNLDLFNPTQEHLLLRETLQEFVQKEVEPQAQSHDREEKFNLPLFRKLADLGLLGITIPEKDGGSGMDAVAAVIAHETLSTSDPALCLSYLAHTILFVHNFYHNANPAQRQKYLPPVISGKWIGGMCMSEPGCGTDVLAMKTHAVKKGDRYILNGEKTWITNGCIDEKTLGDIFLVYAKVNGKISTFVVEKGRKGFHLGMKITGKTGMRASPTASLHFENCEVPAENLLGQEGDSLLHMMRNLEIERLTLAAMSLGIALRCLQIMVPYAQERKAFGQSIASFGQIQRYIAQSYAEFFAARCYVYNTARQLNFQHAGHRLNSDGVKLIATTMAKNVADRAIQVLGGNGYVSEYVVERLWRDAKLLEIGGGTLEAHQKNIAKDLQKSWKEVLK
ncbi:MAG: isovaleryl-CoA dehydrogenase [Planctomycetota bacterium]|nr:MAG: isovaleryl-CoA dehydrogenase [Planctomycetota bacterium]